MDLKGRNFLTLLDYQPREIEHILRISESMKKDQIRRELKEKSLAMLFQKSSTRTRISFEVGMTQLGGHALFLDMKNTQLGRGESIGDTARTISRYCDGIMARLNKHSDAEGLAEYATVPVINALTDLYHPCQTMADLETVLEHKKKVAGLKVVFFGDCGFNMFNSTAIGFTKLGASVVACCPEKGGYVPDMEGALAPLEPEYRGKISVEHDPMAAAEGADVIYTDTWVSMGQDEEKAQRLADLKPYQVNAGLMAKAPNAIFMHCLPAHRGEEVTDEVIDGPQSVVFDQAENRLHAQKGILVELMGGE